MKSSNALKPPSATASPDLGGFRGKPFVKLRFTHDFATQIDANAKKHRPLQANSVLSSIDLGFLRYNKKRPPKGSLS